MHHEVPELIKVFVLQGYGPADGDPGGRWPEVTCRVGDGAVLLTTLLCCVFVRHLVYFLFLISQMRKQDRNPEDDMSAVTQRVTADSGSHGTLIPCCFPLPCRVAANLAGWPDAHSERQKPLCNFHWLPPCPDFSEAR